MEFHNIGYSMDAVLLGRYFNRAKYLDGAPAFVTAHVRTCVEHFPFCS